MEFGGLGLFVRDWGPTGLCGIFIILLFVGRLHTDRSVTRMLKEQEKVVAAQELRIAEALERERHYRQASELLQETVSLQAKQLGETVEQGRLIIALLQSLSTAANAPQGGRHAG